MNSLISKVQQFLWLMQLAYIKGKNYTKQGIVFLQTSAECISLSYVCLYTAIVYSLLGVTQVHSIFPPMTRTCQVHISVHLNEGYKVQAAHLFPN